MSTRPRSGRPVVRSARRGGRGASGLALACAIPLLLACGGAEGAASSEHALLTRLAVGDSLTALERPAAYAGVIECAGCSKAPSTLVLFPDGTFRLRRPDAGAASVSVGRWIVSTDSLPRLSLQGGASDLQFVMISPLRLRPADSEGGGRGGPRELLRVSAPHLLPGRLALRGEFRDEPSGPSLVTCDGGQRFALRGGEPLTRLRRVHADHPLGDGAATLVALVGHLDLRGADAEDAEGTLVVIDSFTPLPELERCEAMHVRATIAVGDWVATVFEGADLSTLAPAERLTLRFVLSEPTMFGHAGCNRFTGRAVLRGLDLQPQPLALTRRACADSIGMAREERYSQTLSRGGWFRLDGGDLVLSRGGSEVARFRRR